jgi:hypothetical protein
MTGLLEVAATFVVYASSGSPTDTLDVCRLLTLAEVHRVAPAAEAGKGDTIDVDEHEVMSKCTWGAMGLMLRVFSGADYPLRGDLDTELEGSTEMRDRRPIKVEQVQGLGDEAYAVIAPRVDGSTLPDAAMLYVKYKNRYYCLDSTVLGRLDHDRALRALETVMRAAMSRS